MDKTIVFKYACFVYAIAFALISGPFVESAIEQNKLNDLALIWSTEILPRCFITIAVRVIGSKLIFPILADRVIIDGKHRGAERTKRIASVSDHLFKSLFFLFVVISAFVALRDIDWVPSEFLFGTSNDSAQRIVHRLIWNTDSLRHSNLPRGVRAYFHWTAAYHLHELGWLLCAHFGDYIFYEMLLHHLVTLSLIVFCFVTGHTAMGSLVTAIHDITHIPVHCTKIAMSTSRITLVVVAYFSLVASWIHYRCYVFGAAIIYPIYLSRFEPRNGNLNRHEVTVYLMLLSTLWTLHLFWICSILRMGYRFVAKGVVHDSLSSKEPGSE